MDPTHPLIFPTLYVAVATLAPTAWLFGARRPLGFIHYAALDAGTPRLMALAVIGFVVGAGLPFTRRHLESLPRDRATLRLAGHALFVFALGLAAYGYATDLLLARGEDQNTRGLLDSLDAAAFILAPAAMLLIAAGRAQLAKPFSRGDLLAALVLIGLLGLSGRRGEAIAVVLVAVFAYIQRPDGRPHVKPVLLGAILLLAFAYQVVVYRTAALGSTTHLDVLEVLLRDLGSVVFTTGVTARFGVQLDGSTLIADLVRQIPSPIANTFLGQPTDTGAFVFRRLLGVPDDMGYGYSIPAEGVLNFGAWGAFLLPCAMGAAMAWLYARADFNATRARQLAYYAAAATLPFAWRSDVLGAVKGVLYPVIMIWLVLVYARTVHRWITEYPSLRSTART